MSYWLSKDTLGGLAACCYCGQPIEGGTGQVVYRDRRADRAEHYKCAAEYSALIESRASSASNRLVDPLDALEAAGHKVALPATEVTGADPSPPAEDHCGSFCWDKLTNRRYLAIQPWRSVARPPAREEWADAKAPANESDALDNPWLVRDKRGYHVVAFESLSFEEPRSRIVRLAGQLYEELLSLILSVLLFLIACVSADTTTRRPK